jgi:hypothetical protein
LIETRFRVWIGLLTGIGARGKWKKKRYAKRAISAGK